MGSTCSVDQNLTASVLQGEIVVKGLPCPVDPGVLTVTEAITVPLNAPPGAFAGTLSAVDQDGEELICVKATFTL